MSELEFENSGTCSSGAQMLPEDTAKLPDAEKPCLEKMINEMKPCSVVLEKLSEDVINDYLSRIDLNFSKQERAKKKFAKHKLRYMSKLDYHLFEKYRNTRQKFINKERRKSEDYADEDFDPERYFSDGRSKKKRSRRKPAYEDDYDWDPSGGKDTYANKVHRSAYSPKKLRRIMKRPISESESSSSSSDFFMNFLMEEDKETFSENELSASKSAGTTSFTSVGDISQVVTNAQITSATKATDGDQTDFNASKVLSKTTSDSSSLNHNSDSSKNNDVVSKIMKDMDNLKSAKDVNKIYKHSNASVSNRGKLNKNVVLRPTGQMRKRSKLRNPDVRVVRAIINNMVDLVCSAENKRLRNIVNNNDMKKKCKWCSTPFTSSNKNDVYCIICKDMKSGFTDKPVYKKQNKPKSNEKNLGAAKATNSKSKMMDKLRKNMPKYDIQRLMYADKAVVEKGYNHCKSFSTPKEGDIGITTFSNPCTFSKEQQSGKMSNKGHTQKKKNNQPNIHVNAAVTSGKSILRKPNPSKAKKVSKSSPTFVLNNSSKKISENQKINANQVCVTNVDKGLFLMTFPEPDKELDVNVLKESTLENANNINRSTVIKVATDKLESKKDLSSSIKNIQPPGTAVKKLPFGTYLLPPVPAVVVANYAAADDSNGDFYLSSVYYQNEMTQQKGTIVDNVMVRNENLNNNFSMTSVAPSMPTDTNLINMSSASIFPANQNNILMPVASLSDGSFIKTVDMISNSGTKSSELARHLTLPVTDLNQMSHSNMSFSSNVVSTADCNASVTQNCFSSENQLIPNVSNMNSEMSLLEMNSESIAQDQESTKEQISNDFDPSNTNAALDTSTSNSNVHINVSMDNNADRNTSSKISLSKGNSRLSELDEVSLNSDTSSINANSSEDLLIEAYQEIEAISILGVVDLDKNPHKMIAYKIEAVKKEFEQLSNQKDKAVDERLNGVYSHYMSLLLAKKLLNKYRSFAGVSEHYLRKEKLMQIKKEKMTEEDNERPACQYSKNSATVSNELANFVGEESASSTSLKTDQMNKSYSLADDAAVNHIEKIQSQIAAINETSSPNDHVPVSVVHHFPTPSNSAVTVSTPVTPGNELGNDSRETPSRGSGPRTPARPESATSQLEESVLTPLQVKKERLETVTSPFSQCAYSVSSPSPHLTTASPNISQVTSPLPNMRLVNSNVSLSNNNLPQFQNMAYSQNNDILPNRTVPFNTNQNVSKVLLNIATHQQQIQNSNPNMNINHPQNSLLVNNGKVINVQQIYLPEGTRFTQKVNAQPVPSVSNTNQYILRQTSMNTASTNGGTVLVNNNNHVGAQNIWHGNEANSQVFAPQQVSQVYNTSSTQMTGSASHQQSSSLAFSLQNKSASSHQQSSSPAFAVQNKQSAAESTGEMICAVCKNIATLRCKQCAKVAYCNTTCAKTYWHKKHKMECKAMTNLI